MTTRAFMNRSLLLMIGALALMLQPTTAQSGSIAWRFALPGQYVPVDPVLGQDGTIYVMDLLGELHAVDPSGNEIWSVPGVGPSGLDIGPDGTLYTSNDFGVTALSSEGAVLWEYFFDPIALVSFGPAVGPDGNIYVVAGSFSPQGAVISLTPSGAERWSTSLTVLPTVTFGQPVFGLAPDGGQQFVFSAGNILARVDLDDGALDGVADGTGGRVVTNSVGSIFHLGRGYDSSGNLLFTGLKIIEAAAADGAVYAKTSQTLQKLDSEDASVLWSLPVATGVGTISPNPDDTRLLFGGSGNALQPPGKIHYAASAGSLLWSLDLPVDDGRVSIMHSRAVFTPDASQAYFGSSTLFQGPALGCYLYAVQVEPGSPWTLVQGGVAGAHGLPQLSGEGELAAGSSVTLRLTGAPPSGTANLVVGFGELSLPFKSGVLVPKPDFVRVNLPVDAAGEHALSFNWPAGVPSGFTTWMQHWIADGSAPSGWAASNGLRAVAP